MVLGVSFTIFHVEGEGNNIRVKKLNRFKEIDSKNWNQLGRVKIMKLIRLSKILELIRLVKEMGLIESSHN